MSHDGSTFNMQKAEKVSVFLGEKLPETAALSLHESAFFSLFEKGMRSCDPSSDLKAGKS